MNAVMIERVIQAIGEADYKFEGLEIRKALYEAYAIAAIKAMREPTDKMSLGGLFYLEIGTVEDVYRAMIDAALGEHK